MIHIFLLAGQSNMVGDGVTSQLPDAWRAAPPNVRLFEEDAWRDLLWQDHFGPEVAFAHAVADVYGDDRIVLCKVAEGGTNLHYDWHPAGVSRGPEDQYRGPLYPQLTGAMAKLKSECGGDTEPMSFAGMLWLQGERDALFDFMAAAYASNLANFMDAVRQDTQNESLPFIVGQIAPRFYRLHENAFAHKFRHVVQAAQAAVARADPYAALVETIDLPQSDNMHYDTGGQLELGKRFAHAWLSIAGRINDVPGDDTRWVSCRSRGETPGS